MRLGTGQCRTRSTRAIETLTNPFDDILRWIERPEPVLDASKFECRLIRDRELIRELSSSFGALLRKIADSNRNIGSTRPPPFICVVRIIGEPEVHSFRQSPCA